MSLIKQSSYLTSVGGFWCDKRYKFRNTFLYTLAGIFGYFTLKIRNKYCVWKTIDTDEREWSREIWYVLYTNKNVKPLSKIKKLGDLQYRYISCLSLSLSFNIVFISVLSLMLSRHLSLSLIHCCIARLSCPLNQIRAKQPLFPRYSFLFNDNLN